MKGSYALGERLGRLLIFIGAIAAAAIAWQLASFGPARADDKPNFVDINRHLSSLIRSAPATGELALPASSSLSSARASTAFRLPARSQSWPFRIPVAVLRLTRFERALHLHTNTINANFWGVFQGGRGTYVHVSFHFE